MLPLLSILRKPRAFVPDVSTDCSVLTHIFIFPNSFFNRYKLLEQQVYPGTSWVSPTGTVISRPPPPYPSSSPVSTSQSSFIFAPGIRPDKFPPPQHQGSIGDSRFRGPRPPSTFVRSISDLLPLYS